MKEITMYAVIDENNNIAKVTYEDCIKKYLIHKSKEDAEEELNLIIESFEEQIEELQEELEEFKEPELTKRLNTLKSIKKYYEKCKIIPIKLVPPSKTYPYTLKCESNFIHTKITAFSNEKVKKAIEHNQFKIKTITFKDNYLIIEIEI